MSLRAYSRLDTGVAVIEFTGKVTLGQGAAFLRESITQTLADGYRNILLDLEHVTYIDSAGLGELVNCSKIARRQGADIRLVNLQKKINDLLQITKLTTLFQTFEDEYEAVRSFHQSGTAPS